MAEWDPSKLVEFLPLFRQLLTLKQYSGGLSGQLLDQLSDDDLLRFLNQKYSSWKIDMENANAYKANVRHLINQIEEVLHQRHINPDLEPEFDSTFYTNTDFRKTRTDFDDPTEDKKREVFRLVFGPPRSESGLFLLSSDGLYYDSQKGGLDPVYIHLNKLDMPDVGDIYKFNHAANLGGRGDDISLADIEVYTNTLFDVNLIDDSDTMRNHYDNDHFLQVLEGQRNKRIFDLSGAARRASNDGSGIAYVRNLKNEIYAAMSRWDSVIDKRKKQIEIAIKATSIYGDGVPQFDPTRTLSDEDNPFVVLPPGAAAGGTYTGPCDTPPGVPPPPGCSDEDTGGGPGGPGPGGGNPNAYNIPIGTGEGGTVGGVASGRSTVDPSGYVGKTLFPFGQIPVNDFSYLAQFNFAIDEDIQEKLFFKTGEVKDVVLPVNARFTKPYASPLQYNYSHLLIPPVGKGSIIYDPSGSDAAVLSLTTGIHTDNLLAIYNFLDGEVSFPGVSGMDASNVTNCNAVGNFTNYGHMVGANASSVFAAGLGIPYFEGMTRNSSDDPFRVSSLGSVMVLPETDDFQDLTYGPSGFTFETWVRVPGLAQESGWHSNGNVGNQASALTKCILACENTGVDSDFIMPDPADGVPTITTLGEGGYIEAVNAWSLDNLPNHGPTHTKGMIIGFTRDRRMVAGLPGSGERNKQDPVGNGVSLVIAPTVARDASSLSWISKDGGPGGGYGTRFTYDYYGLTVNCSALNANRTNGEARSFFDTSGEFVLLDVTVNPLDNIVNVYMDGELMGSETIPNTFGTGAYQPPSLPTFIKPNSFEYSSNSVNGPNQLHEGPKPHGLFTPWILGGGYTDGMTFDFLGDPGGSEESYAGNFFGGGTNATGGTLDDDGSPGGITSGLRGYLGSTKFYNCALQEDQIKTNYLSQKGFFKFIDLRLSPLG